MGANPVARSRRWPRVPFQTAGRRQDCDSTERVQHQEISVAAHQHVRAPVLAGGQNDETVLNRSPGRMNRNSWPSSAARFVA